MRIQIHLASFFFLAIMSIFSGELREKEKNI